MIRERLIAYGERATGEDASWMRDVAALGWGAFGKLLGFYRLANYRHAAPAELTALARLGAVMAEDCGPCTRIAFRMARRAGVPAELLRAGLTGGAALTGDPALAYRFGRAVAAGEAEAGEVGDAIEARFGRGVRTELALAAATVRFYPAMKRGLGYARACELTPFNDL